MIFSCINFVYYTHKIQLPKKLGTKAAQFARDEQKKLSPKKVDFEKGH